LPSSSSISSPFLMMSGMISRASGLLESTETAS
jgi:hypothetical protein